MSMTREEASKILRDMLPGPIVPPVYPGSQKQGAIQVALTALRGPTREMVERMRGECGKCSMPENMALDAGGAHEFRISGDAIYYCDSEYGWEGEKISYCPWCGKPLTDEAVDMMLERWREALDENT